MVFSISVIGEIYHHGEIKIGENKSIGLVGVDVAKNFEEGMLVDLLGFLF